MYCPECRGEFRDGYTFCRKCNVDLVDELPVEEEAQVKEKMPSLKKRFETNIENWLKYGGIIYIFIGVLYDVTSYIGQFFPPHNRLSASGLSFGFTVFSIINLCHSILNTILWGLVYFGLGKIIEVLKEGFKYEKQ